MLLQSPSIFPIVRHVSCALRVGTAALLLLFSSIAAAQEATAEPILVSFQYNAPPSCPLEDRAFKLLQSRSERVARAEDDSGAQRLVVDIATDRTGYHGTLTVIRPDAAVERRSMKGANCAEVVEALALTAALSIDPNATLTLSSPAQEEGTPSSEPVRQDTEGAQDAPGGRATQKDATSPNETSSTLPPDEPRRRFRYSSTGTPNALRTTLGLAFSYARIMHNSPHLGGGLSLGISEPGGRVLFPLDVYITLQALFEPAPDEPPRIATRFFLAQLSYCPIHVGLIISFAACGRLDLGALTGTSVGFEEAETESQVTRFYASAGAEGRLTALLADHWTVWAAPGLSFPLTQRQFAVEPGPAVLAETLDVTWNVTLGFGWTF